MVVSELLDKIAPTALVKLMLVVAQGVGKGDSMPFDTFKKSSLKKEELEYIRSMSLEVKSIDVGYLDPKDRSSDCCLVVVCFINI